MYFCLETEQLVHNFKFYTEMLQYVNRRKVFFYGCSSLKKSFKPGENWCQLMPSLEHKTKQPQKEPSLACTLHQDKRDKLLNQHSILPNKQKKKADQHSNECCKPWVNMPCTQGEQLLLDT